ncbi:MAG: K(+)-transporting ATPase subunit F [Gemmatimonadaceae bacterium]|nr:K(+)-transporting ATPase subunit F [Gemmatimonadaceae bacterium]
MNAESATGIAIAIALMAYLVYSLLRPERF